MPRRAGGDLADKGAHPARHGSLAARGIDPSGGQLLSAVSIPGRSGIVAELEDALAAFLGVRHTVTTCTGTAALHSMYAAAGIARVTR